MELNTYQSPIPDNLSKYVRSELHEAIDQITFISNLISKDRPTISSLPINKDNGTIPIDLANPHILEDMDYFRQPALSEVDLEETDPKKISDILKIMPDLNKSLKELEKQVKAEEDEVSGLVGSKTKNIFEDGA